MNEIFEVFLGILFELALKGPGYLIARCVYRQETFDPDGFLVVLLGIGFWIAIGLTIWGISLLL